MKTKFSEVPSHLEIERRYLLSSAPDMRHPALVMARPIHIVQTYLGPVPGWRSYSRVRESRVGGTCTYEWAAKQRVSAMTKREAETEINRPTYDWLLTYANDRPVTHKTRWSFRSNGLVFDLDKVSGDEVQWVLEVELDSEEQEFTLPQFLQIEREITFESAVA